LSCAGFCLIPQRAIPHPQPTFILSPFFPARQSAPVWAGKFPKMPGKGPAMIGPSSRIIIKPSAGNNNGGTAGVSFEFLNFHF
jgi:hypothetical protein